MKHYVIIISLLIIVACVKEPDHHIRIRNLSSTPVTIIIDDTVKFDTIPIQQKSVYKPIQEGSHQIGGDYFGNFVVEGAGTHKWTLEVYDNNFELVED
ncbi:MAG TPA: hypothetical protein PLS12_10320 [Bacteroidales bacterium]|jgi:hypothetical protein|nr:hypothetical protein [Bacteroidales bacterium]